MRLPDRFRDRFRAVLTKQFRQRCRFRHFLPPEDALLATGCALVNQKREAHEANWILATKKFRSFWVQAFPVVGVCVPTEWTRQGKWLHKFS